MCVMEVHQRQHSATMVQACLHNTGTIRSDVEMVLPILRARGVPEYTIVLIEDARAALAGAYYDLFAAFENESERAQQGHDIDSRPIGNERTHVKSVDAADAAISGPGIVAAAEQYETR